MATHGDVFETFLNNLKVGVTTVLCEKQNLNEMTTWAIKAQLYIILDVVGCEKVIVG